MSPCLCMCLHLCLTALGRISQRSFHPHPPSSSPPPSQHTRRDPEDPVWQMARLRARYLSCFYCGKRTGTRFDGVTRQFTCQSCDATNYLDEVPHQPPTSKHPSIQHSLGACQLTPPGWRNHRPPRGDRIRGQHLAESNTPNNNIPPLVGAPRLLRHVPQEPAAVHGLAGAVHPSQRPARRH